MENKDFEIEQMRLLFDISQKLDKSLDLKEVIGPVLELIAKRLGMLRGSITILNRETKEISIDASYGLSQKQKNLGRYKLGEGITGTVVERGEPIFVPKIAEETMFLNRTKSRVIQNNTDISFICVPIKIEKSIIGAISFDRVYDPEKNYEKEINFIKIITSMIGQAVRLRQSATEEIDKLKEANKYLQEELKTKFHPSNIIGNSKMMKDVYLLIENIIGNKATVLIRGESGVGKELVAQAIHYRGARAEFPFVKVNCAALPDNLIEAELFGHEKGAFTGAVSSRKGRFEAADKGTIFLDEIGDMPLSTQIKVLRVLQEREIERVGGTTPIKIDVRIVCATNQPLEKLIEEGKFRLDLYYRINVFPIYVPALRERKDDILLLAEHFIRKISLMNNKEIKRISSQAIDMLMAYHWPGNVRELENCMERAVIMSNDGVIHGYNLPPSLQTSMSSGDHKIGKLDAVISSIEKDMIIDALKITKGNMLKAAKELEITERMMGIRIEKYNINIKQFKNG